MNIFVGNLNYTSTEETIRTLFETHGEVESVRIITDRYSGRSRGFGFVEMPNEEEAQAAIEALDGQEFEERALRVNVAKPKPDRGEESPSRKSGW